MGCHLGVLGRWLMLNMHLFLHSCFASVFYIRECVKNKLIKQGFLYVYEYDGRDFI